MKKRLFYLVSAVVFLLGVTDVFAINIYNGGVASGFDLESGNTYTCGDTNKAVLKLQDETNENQKYYTTSCDVNFPCNALSQNENDCVVK